MERGDHTFTAEILGEDLPDEVAKEAVTLLQGETLGITASDGHYYEFTVETVKAEEAE